MKFSKSQTQMQFRDAVNDSEYSIIRDLINSGRLKDVNVKKILKQVNKNCVKDFYYDILHFVICKEVENFDILKFYVENGIDVNGDALTAAITYGHLEIVKFLIESGAKSDFCLSYTVEYGQLDIAKYLIESGASVDDDLLNDLPNYGIYASEEYKKKIAEVVKFLRNTRMIETD